VKGIILLAGFQILAPIFYFVQRSGDRVGGPISFVKSCWLIFAITLWVIGPFVFATLTPETWIRHAWWLLGASMLLRGGIELVLCYVTHGWKTEYGIAHDAFQIGLCTFFLLTLASGPSGFLSLHSALVGLTVVSLICEMGFVATFLKLTGGPREGVYFVSGAQTRINRITAGLLIPQHFTLWIILSSLVAQ